MQLASRSLQLVTCVTCGLCSLLVRRDLSGQAQRRAAPAAGTSRVMPRVPHVAQAGEGSGAGSRRNGIAHSAYSTKHGAVIPFGNTLEHAIHGVVGVDERGDKYADHPFRHETGQGYITPTRGRAQYRDAVSRGRPIHLMLVETTGAIHADLYALLRALSRQSRRPTTHDFCVFVVSLRAHEIKTKRSASASTPSKDCLHCTDRL